MVNKILLVNEEQRCSDILNEGIILAGYSVQQEINVVPTLAFSIKDNPEAIIFNLNGSLSQKLILIEEMHSTSALPVIVFAESASKNEISQAIKSGIHALIINGLVKERIPAIIDMALIRFNEEQSRLEELLLIKRNLEDRKIIDRAKGVLMDLRGMKEQEAYQSLRKIAMDQNKCMAEVGSDVIEMFKYIA